MYKDKSCTEDKGVKVLMKAEYIRDFKRNYLVFNENGVLTDNYEIKMLIENDIPGVLRCKDRMVNGEGFLYYDVTSKQTFRTMFEDNVLHMQDIRKLLMALKKTCENMEKFLLYDDGLMLDPDYIFMDPETEEYGFLYYRNDEAGDISKLVEFFIEHMDNEDMELVEAVYKMADVTGRGHFALDETLHWFEDEYGKDVPTEKTPQVVEENTPEINHYEEWEKDLYTDEEPVKKTSFFDKLKALFKKKDKKEALIEYEEDLSYEEESFQDAIRQQSNETVFIPWVENSEHKLYGIGKANKTHIDLNRAPMTIGKLSDRVDLVLKDESISRIHAKILRNSGHFMLMDLNSTNGSFRNGVRLAPNESVLIEPGDEIGIGKLKFIYR